MLFNELISVFYHRFRSRHLAVMAKSASGILKRYVQRSCTHTGRMASSPSTDIPQQKFILLMSWKTVNSSLILHCCSRLSKNANAFEYTFFRFVWTRATYPSRYLSNGDDPRYWTSPRHLCMTFSPGFCVETTFSEFSMRSDTKIPRPSSTGM